MMAATCSHIRRCISLLPTWARGLSTAESSIHVVTKEVPGPRSRQLREELLDMQEMATVNLVSDLSKSKGNFMADVDGNVFLDCFMQIATIPLGYNHPALVRCLSDPANIHALVNRPAMPWFPNEQWIGLLKETVLSVAPKGLDQIYPMMCGSCSNENAIKLMFMRYMDKKRGGRPDFTAEELSSTMSQEAPGCPDLCILSFKGGFHGRTIGLLSCSNSRPIHGVDIPSLKWPKADFPLYKYPLEEHERENRAEDDRCLASVEEHIEAQAKKALPVAGIMVEPIQAEGGDNHGSKHFFQGLDAIAHKYDLSLLIDEVQTGGGSSGKMWCHEHFELQHGPDIVTFAKKMLMGGIYHNRQHRPKQPGRIMNTWVGDPHKVLMLREVLRVIRQDGLLQLQQQSGQVMITGLKDLETRYPDLIAAPRGIGTICAVDCPSVQLRDRIVSEMRHSGVILGGCGEKSIRFRPALVFAPHHAHLMLDKLDQVLLRLSGR